MTNRRKDEELQFISIAEDDEESDMNYSTQREHSQDQSVGNWLFKSKVRTIYLKNIQRKWKI